MRGAFTASCGAMPCTVIFSNDCKTIVMIRDPPGEPNTIAGFPSRSTMVGDIDEIARADGKVITASQTQLVQNLEGGIITKIFVKEGDLVAL